MNIYVNNLFLYIKVLIKLKYMKLLTMTFLRR